MVGCTFIATVDYIASVILAFASLLAFGAGDRSAGIALVALAVPFAGAYEAITIDRIRCGAVFMAVALAIIIVLFSFILLERRKTYD